jgi:acetyl esterase/lipase
VRTGRTAIEHVVRASTVNRRDVLKLGAAAVDRWVPRQAEAQTPKRGGVFRLAGSTRPISTRTRRHTGGRSSTSFTHSRLVKVKAAPAVAPGTLPLEGDLAESWSQPTDTTWVFCGQCGAPSRSIRSPIRSRASATCWRGKGSRRPRPDSAKRLIASHRAYFPTESAMAEASVTRVLSAKEATALPPVWIAQAGLDDNVAAAITEAFVGAYREAGGPVECVHFPGARHGFIQQSGPDTDKCVGLVREFIGRQLRRA